MSAPLTFSLTQILESLPVSARQVIEAVRLELSQQPKTSFYLVGGAVRDLFLDVPIKDVDTVIEGSQANTLAQHLQDALDINVTCHPDFMTCSLELADDSVFDIATARSETYTHPGALPHVTVSDITDDLARRDFSVNALAVRLSPEPVTLLDPCGGLADLERRELKVLHPRSFLDDPTRLVRGARLAGRLGFDLAPTTAALIPAALLTEILEQVSAARLRNEFELTLNEARVLPALQQLAKHDILKKMFGLSLDVALIARLDELDAAGDAYLLALLQGLKPEKVTPWLKHFAYPLRLLESTARLREIRSTNTVSTEQFKRTDQGERTLISTFSKDLAQRLGELEARTKERGLTGRDVIGLGLPEGRRVGQILRKVAEAQDAGTVTNFEEALTLARKLVSLES